MRIHGLVSCVNYFDLFTKSIALWRHGLDELTVVTSPADTHTQALCRQHSAGLYITDSFFKNGALFNKGYALSVAAHELEIISAKTDWVLIFDADMVPPADWRAKLEAANGGTAGSGLHPGFLYGARCWQQPEHTANPVLNLKHKPIPQDWVIGFFSLFHATDQCVPKPPEPLFDVCWPTAGCFDTVFTRRWPPNYQVILAEPKFIHLGEERTNWCGREPSAKKVLAKILRQRRKREDWSHERMHTPPAWPPESKKQILQDVPA